MLNYVVNYKIPRVAVHTHHNEQLHNISYTVVGYMRPTDCLATFVSWQSLQLKSWVIIIIRLSILETSLDPNLAIVHDAQFVQFSIRQVYKCARTQTGPGSSSRTLRTHPLTA